MTLTLILDINQAIRTLLIQDCPSSNDWFFEND